MLEVKPQGRLAIVYNRNPFPVNKARRRYILRARWAFGFELTATINWPPEFGYDNVAKAAIIS